MLILILKNGYHCISLVAVKITLQYNKLIASVTRLLLELLYKIKVFLTINYYNFIKFYLCNRKFRTRASEDLSNMKPITSGEPQGSVLDPLLYLLFTANLRVDQNTIMATFADDTIIFSTNDDPKLSTRKPFQYTFKPFPVTGEDFIMSRTIQFLSLYIIVNLVANK